MFSTDATHLAWIMPCNGSRLLLDGNRGRVEDTTVRDEGNAWHWYSEQLFKGLTTVEWCDGMRAPNNILITPSMHQHAIEYVAALCAGDMELDTTWSWGDSFEVRGRADHVSYMQAEDTLYVDDGKYGYTPVEPEENWTLLSHAIAWVLRYGGNHVPRKIVFTIHQPRGYHPLGNTRSWTITGGQFNDYFARMVSTLCNLTDQLQTGPYCFKCSKRLNCPAARISTKKVIDTLAVAYNDSLDAEQLADELKTMRYANSLVKSRLDALEEEALHRSKRGETLPGFQVVPTYSNRQVRKHVTPELVKAFTGRDVTVVKTRPLSEWKGLGVPEAIIDTLTTRVETGHKLVVVDTNALVNKMLEGK